MGFLFKRKPETIKTRTTHTGGGLRVDDFCDPGPTPGNVGVCLSGGGSRAMTAGMGQLRGLANLQIGGRSLLDQTRALSTVSGGSWIGQTYSYLQGASVAAYLNAYVADPGRLVLSASPGHSQAETLDQLPKGNPGRNIDRKLFSPVGLAVSALVLWKFLKVPPEMLWQTLVGTHLLEPYDLYQPSKRRAPDSFFSFDQASLQQDVLDLNPNLDDETVHLVAPPGKPLPICNQAMFVDQPGSAFEDLAPVQSTPFITGILGTPGGTDANGKPTGGGGVTSFAFSSQPEGQVNGLVTAEQQRQWALTDSIGTSSAFFAEKLQNLFSDWRGDIDDFFAKLDEVLEDLEQWLRKLAGELGLAGKLLALLLEGLGELAGQARAGRPERLERLFARTGMDRKSLQSDFAELAIQGLIPQYDYWPVSDPSPVSGFRPTRFADGGNLENTGIAGVLAYGDIDNVIAFVNSSTPMTSAALGAFDKQGREIPNSRVLVDGQIPPLFGYQPYREGLGYRLYAGDSNPESPVMRHNQLFPSAAFADLLAAFWERSGNAAAPGSNQHAAICRQNLRLQDNQWFGIQGGRDIGLLWVYNNRVHDWYRRLSPAVQRLLGDFDDPDSYSGFPNYSTLDTDLDATQINLLASLSAWVVADADNAGACLGMYADP